MRPSSCAWRHSSWVIRWCYAVARDVPVPTGATAQRVDRVASGWRGARWVPDEPGTTTGTETPTGIGYGTITLTNGQTFSWPGAHPCDKMTVLYRQSPGAGSMQIRLKGAGGPLVATVNCAGPESIQAWTGTASGVTVFDPMTLHITSVGATDVQHVMPWGGGKRIRVWNFCVPSATTADHVAGTYKSLEAMASLEDNARPQLALLATGANDVPASYAASIASLITSVEALGMTPVLWVEPIMAAFPAADAAIVRAAALATGEVVLDASLGLPVACWLTGDGSHPTFVGARTAAIHIAHGVGTSTRPINFAAARNDSETLVVRTTLTKDRRNRISPPRRGPSRTLHRLTRPARSLRLSLPTRGRCRLVRGFRPCSASLTGSLRSASWRSPMGRRCLPGRTWSVRFARTTASSRFALSPVRLALGSLLLRRRLPHHTLTTGHRSRQAPWHRHGSGQVPRRRRRFYGVMGRGRCLPTTLSTQWLHLALRKH